MFRKPLRAGFRKSLKLRGGNWAVEVFRKELFLENAATPAYSRHMRTLTGIVSARFGAPTPNLKTIEALLLNRTGLPRMAPGTRNVQLYEPYIVHADYKIERHEYFTHELLKLQKCRVRGHRMIIMRPDSHELPAGIGANDIELVSPIHLRKEWGLVDGNELHVEAEGDDAWWAAPELANSEV